nr:GNAT family N-acetyltransferase [Intestinimonas butyriciproducens]
MLVLPEYRRQGIGSKLLHLAKDNSHRKGFPGSQQGRQD